MVCTQEYSTSNTFRKRTSLLDRQCLMVRTQEYSTSYTFRKKPSLDGTSLSL